MSLDILLQQADLIGAIIAFILTLFVLSYLIGDNFLFRIAIYIFIGAASGYAVVVIVYNVLWQQWLVPVFQDPMAGLPRLAVPFLLGLWLMTKLSPRLARLGNPVLAYLVGVGAATAIGGAILGTIFPQVSASINLFDIRSTPIEDKQLIPTLATGSAIVLGVVTTLVYFQFGARPTPSGKAERPLLIEGISKVGEVFIAITLGVLFAGVYAAVLMAFIERITFIWVFIWDRIAPLISG